MGPVYYGRVVAGPDPYAPLLQYLAAVDARYGLYASELQRILWKGYVSPASAPFYEGISAMPSLHVALPVLFALLAWRTHRGLFWATTAFAVIIFIGSIHLGWHYALDGYVAALGAAVIWWASGKLVGAGHARGAASDDHVHERRATSMSDGARLGSSMTSASAGTAAELDPIVGRSRS